jgi:hypothetical protein
VVKLLALHDLEGKILTLLAQPSDAPLWSRQLEPGQEISEVEAPSTEVELTDPKFVRYMKDLVENYAVSMEPVARRRLVAKRIAQ